jgi:uncharacterized protein (DUF433 family)
MKINRIASNASGRKVSATMANGTTIVKRFKIGTTDAEIVAALDKLENKAIAKAETAKAKKQEAADKKAKAAEAKKQ